MVRNKVEWDRGTTARGSERKKPGKGKGAERWRGREKERGLVDLASSEGSRVAPQAAPSPSIPRFHPPTLAKAHPHAESIC